MRSLSNHFGDIAPYRILLDPWPGTATKQHLVEKIERDNRRVELVDRTLIEKPVGTGLDHLAFTIAYWLDLHVTSRGIGIVFGSRERPRVTREDPDVYFVDRRRTTARRQGWVSGFAKTLVTRLIDPLADEASRRKDRRRHFAIGTRLIWEIDVGRKTIAVYTSAEQHDAILARSATLTGGDVLPGFTLDLGPFWAQFDD